MAEGKTITIIQKGKTEEKRSIVVSLTTTTYRVQGKIHFVSPTSKATKDFSFLGAKSLELDLTNDLEFNTEYRMHISMFGFQDSQFGGLQAGEAEVIPLTMKLEEPPTFHQWLEIRNILRPWN